MNAFKKHSGESTEITAKGNDRDMKEMKANTHKQYTINCYMRKLYLLPPKFFQGRLQDYKYMWNIMKYL